MPFLEMSCIYIHGKDILKTLVIHFDSLRIFYDTLTKVLRMSFRWIYIYIYIYIYTNLPANAIVRPPHPRSGDSQGQEIM